MGPTPNPQSPIPNPQSPLKFFKIKKLFKIINISYIDILIIYKIILKKF